MLRIGTAQTQNSTDIAENFESVIGLLNEFQKHHVDLVLFPECCLSGFSARIQECTLEVLTPYLERIQQWVNETATEVVMPTARVEGSQIFNSGFWFRPGHKTAFHKTGLTESEKKFFSIPTGKSPRIFHIKGYELALLICIEAEHPPWTFFDQDEVDAILWPGYWGWKPEDQWNEKRADDKENLIFKNMNVWKKPLIQSNFAYNESADIRPTGPQGLSYIINVDNKLIHRGPHLKISGSILRLDRTIDGVAVEYERDIFVGKTSQNTNL